MRYDSILFFSLFKQTCLILTSLIDSSGKCTATLTNLCCSGKQEELTVPRLTAGKKQIYISVPTLGLHQ